MAKTIERTFEYNGSEYTVGSWRDGVVTNVRAFKADGTPADAYIFSVTDEVQSDAVAAASLINPLEELIKTAEHYVRDDVYGQYLAAIEAIKNGG